MSTTPRVSTGLEVYPPDFVHRCPRSIVRGRKAPCIQLDCVPPESCTEKLGCRGCRSMRVDDRYDEWKCELRAVVLVTRLQLLARKHIFFLNSLFIPDHSYSRPSSAPSLKKVAVGPHVRLICELADQPASRDWPERSLGCVSASATPQSALCKSTTDTFIEHRYAYRLLAKCYDRSTPSILLQWRAPKEKKA